MRRKIQPIYGYPIPCTPWFSWKECDSCKWEFRREAGWVYAFPWGTFDVQYFICGACAPDLDSAKRIVDRKANPPPPSAPPVKP